MKARFYLKTPPGGEEPAEYVEVDPDDSGNNIVARQANDEDRSRFPEAYQSFRKEQEEQQSQGGAPRTEDQPMGLGIPVTVRAAAPMGREESFTQSLVSPPALAPAPSAQTVGTMNVRTMKVTPEAQTQDEGLQSLNAQEAIARVNATDDGETLERWREQEEEGKRRSTVLDAIDRRLDAVTSTP